MDIVQNRTFVEYPDYYHHSIERFWKAFDRIQHLELAPSARVIDIGGGIMALLLHRLLGLDASVGDVNRRAAGDVEDYGLTFQTVNLMSDTELPNAHYDLVVLQEVIEHLPEPPYIIFERIRRFMSPGGILFLTTPNAARIRNLLYYLTGRQVLDNFRYPEPGEALGHQMEYTLPRMLW
jgi:2-polyprenyl-3-methyl-5-hydroxy-6-metoxy-1,4-benzoquinol methylase